MHADVGQGFQGAQIDLLPQVLLRIARPAFDERGAVMNASDLVGRKFQPTEGVKIQPFVRRAFEATVIQVECVNIEVRDHRVAKTKPPWLEGGFAYLTSEPIRGVKRILSE